MAQPTVTVQPARGSHGSSTALMFGGILAAVIIHRLNALGAMDLSVLMPSGFAGERPSLAHKLSPAVSELVLSVA